MKTRIGFVSNSSTSSFVVSNEGYNNIFDLAFEMVLARAFDDYTDDELMEQIELDRKNPQIKTSQGIAFRTVNYYTCSAVRNPWSDIRSDNKKEDAVQENKRRFGGRRTFRRRPQQGRHRDTF